MALNPTILIVDDDHGIRILLRDLLRDADFEAVTADTISCALDAMEEHQPDVVVLDLSLPDSDEETLRQALASFQRSRLLVVSGSVQIEERARGLGADACMAKPFDLDEFLALVSSLTQNDPTADFGPAA